MSAAPCDSRRFPRRPRRAGLTVIELVIVLFLAFVLVGLALVLVLRMRASGDQLRCQNNLRLIGMAVYVYRDQADPRALPPSRIADGYGTWAVVLAPHLSQDHGKALAGWDPEKPYFQQPDAARRAQVAAYYCPARRMPGAVSVRGDSPLPGMAAPGDFPGALSDYACSSGTGDRRHPWTTDRADGAVIPALVTEKGPDHTIKRWEGRTDFRVLQSGEVRVVRGRGAARTLRSGLGKGTSETILIGEKQIPTGEAGRAEAGDGSVYDGARPANFARVGGPGHGLAQSPAEPVDPDFPQFGSAHSGVCQFLMADGSARAIALSISPEVLGQLVARGEE